jgi:putative transposase
VLQHRLSRNMHITLQSREYVVEKRLPDKTIRLRDVLTDQRTAMPEQELIDALFQKDAELLGHNRNQDALKERLAKTGVCDIATLKEDDPRKIEFERRLSYVKAVHAARLEKRTEETLKPIIEKVASLTADPDPPATMTLYRWLRFYDKSGRDARALVPATKARGNRKRRFLGRPAQKGDLKNNQEAQERASRVAELVDAAIDQVYLTNQRFTVRAVHDALSVKIDDANSFRGLDDQLPLPNRSSIDDVVKKLDDYDIVEARYGKKIADEKYRAIRQGARPTRPHERVEGDHATTDLFVVDPITKLPIGRAFLTWLIDVYTKMILGFYISFNPPSYLTVMECLKHAIRPKTYVKRKYSNIKNDWNTYGIPEVLVVDNAREFHGRNLEDACHQLGIVLQFSPRGKPWIRTTVERSFRTIATQLHHQQPGTTFSDIIDRADYEPGKMAIVTPDVLDEITHKWIVDIYQVSGHRGIRDVPALRWEKGIAEWPPALPVNNEFLDVALGYTEERVVSSRGIELDNLFYNDEELAMVRRSLERHKKVIVKRNPSDLSLIHVYDEKHDKYLAVPAIDQDYTKSLTLYQHTVICRYVRERLKRNVDVFALARAKREVQEIVEREWNAAGGKMLGRKRAARFLKEGVQDNREGIERQNFSDEPKSRRISAPTKPKLLLHPANSSDNRILDIETQWNPTDPDSKEEPTNLQLVRPEENPAAARSPMSSGKNRKTKKQPANKKSDAKPHSNSGTKKKPANNETGKQTSMPVDQPDEELDMTGWSGNYNLAK